MRTLDADDHDLMKHMHRPDPNRSPEMPGQGMAIILLEGLYEAWFEAQAIESRHFIRRYRRSRLGKC